MTARTNVGTVDDLHASATKACGLDDYGNDDYIEALGVLLDSYGRDAELTEEGSRMFRYFLRGALVARLLSEASWRAHPTHRDVSIPQPIFVTGLPRTGTTALHRLLTADPRHQGLQMWLTEVPQPRPPPETWSDNPVFQQIEAGFAQHHLQDPEFMGLHYMSAAEVEECWQLLRQTMKSISYESLAYLPTYSQWLQGQEWTNAYQRHRCNLQLIGMNDRDRRWVLKNPSHLFALDELMAVYPDAIVIQTHRAPSTVIPSMCSLAEHATRGWSRSFVGGRIGESQLELWSRGLRRFKEARGRYDQSQFIDVSFRELRDAPMSTVEKLYGTLGLSLTAEARAAMATLDASSRVGARKPANDYTLEDFGLTKKQVDEQFVGLLPEA